MENIIIKYDHLKHNEAITLLHALKHKINAFKAAYIPFVEDTELPELSKDLLLDVISDGRSAVERAIDRYVEKQKKALQKYYAEACYTALAKHLDAPIAAFSEWKHRSRSENIPHVILQSSNLPISDQMELVITKEFEESIRTHFELKISSDLDIQLLEKYQALGTAYNELMELAERNDVRIPQQFSNLFRTMGMIHVPRVKICPEVFLPSQTNSVLKEQFESVTRRE